MLRSLLLLLPVSSVGDHNTSDVSLTPSVCYWSIFFSSHYTVHRYLHHFFWTRLVLPTPATPLQSLRSTYFTWHRHYTSRPPEVGVVIVPRLLLVHVSGTSPLHEPHNLLYVPPTPLTSENWLLLSPSLFQSRVSRNIPDLFTSFRHLIQIPRGASKTRGSEVKDFSTVTKL